MNSLENNDSMADFLRLQNLKNLTSRRLRGRTDNQFLDMQNPDLSGTALPPPPAPMVPQVPGNFDVRANQKIEPPPIEQGPASNDGGLFSKLSNGLKWGLQTIGGGRYPEQDDEPPMSQEMAIPAPSNLTEKSGAPLAGPGALNSMTNQEGIMNILTGKRQAPGGEMLQAGINPMLLGMIGQFLPSVFGGQSEASESPTPPQNPLAPPLAQQNPNPDMNAQPPAQTTQPPEIGTNTQPGSVSRVMQDPMLKSKIDEIFGPVDPAMAQAASSYEKAMNAYANSLDDVTARLDDREKAIRQKIESRNLNTQDKILMALALIAPAIAAGLMGGKEALIGALGGGAKGIADVFGGRAKDAKEEGEELSGLALDKSKVAKEKAGIEPLTAEFRSKLAASIPNKDLREIFNRDGKLIGDKLVINSGNENLPIKADAIRDLDDYKRIKKEIPKLATSVSSMDKAMELIDSLHNLADAGIQSKNNKNILQKGAHFVGGANPLGINLYDAASGAMKAFFPFTQDTVRDKDGKEYKISALMNTYRTQLADVWRDAKNKNGNAFKATEEHFNKQLPNPTDWKAFLSGESDLTQFKKQLDLVKQNFESVIHYLDEQGIDTTELQKKIGSTNRNQTLKKEDKTLRRQQEATADALSRQGG